MIRGIFRWITGSLFFILGAQIFAIFADSEWGEELSVMITGYDTLPRGVYLWCLLAASIFGSILFQRIFWFMVDRTYPVRHV
jgi:hypothetical protein